MATPKQNPSDPEDEEPQWNAVYRALRPPDVSLHSIEEGAKRFRAQDSVRGLWPTRLLHIDTMTSHRRKEGNVYDTSKEPAFTVLSYKWGFWVREGESELDVRGISWAMPAIDPAYFTGAEMRDVIGKLRKHTAWAWIDVACVDQFLTDVTMRDIIDEPRNFRLAARRVAWWLDFPSDILGRLLGDVAEAEAALVGLPPEPGDGGDLEAIPAAVARAFDSWITLVGIPWFSSNWTLREIVLCDEVVILNRAGDPVSLHGRGGAPATIGLVARMCAAVFAWLRRVESRPADLAGRMIEADGSPATFTPRAVGWIR